jgi:N utilization substance protein B
VPDDAPSGADGLLPPPVPQDAEAVELVEVVDPAVSGLSRLDARERALGLLYEAEAKSLGVRDLLASLPLPPEAFAVHLVTGVDDHRVAVDQELTRVSHRWDLERMPALDRAILRIGTYELGWCPEVPVAVVINEAVELAKRFSTDDSGRFVNGVLSRLATDLRR